MISPIKIKGRLIGPGHPVYVIAEMSGNHNQDFDTAIKLLKYAKEVGADAVKSQTFTPDTITLKSDKEYFRVSGGTLWDGQTLYDLYQEACTPWEWQPKLKKIAEDLGLHFFSSAFDPTAVHFLEELKVPVHKVASSELVDIPLIQKMAQTGKPLILSTGMADFKEIEEAVQTARTAGARQIALLKCTAAYPAHPEELNLRTIPHMAETFQVPVGLSDHTLGITVPIAAVSLGACIIEKHFTLSRKHPGPDSAFSLEPEEFGSMVEAIRVSEKSLGQVKYEACEREQVSRSFRRSLFVVKNMRVGELFTEENVRSIRPAHGLKPSYLGEILGKKAIKDIERGTPLTWDLIQ